MSSMPAQRPSRSEQSVRTPQTFITAVKERFGIVEFDRDLAADDHNTVAPLWFTEEQDALIQGWDTPTVNGWNWCNPPYSDIAPWVSRAHLQSLGCDAKTIMLVPASTGSNWWRDSVNGKAYITFLNGRITFVGHNSPYPKDLALLIYTSYLQGGSCVWDWE